jgi:hypothetical protein
VAAFPPSAASAVSRILVSTESQHRDISFSLRAAGRSVLLPPRRSGSVVHLCPRRNDADPSPPRGAVRRPGCSLLVFVPRPDAGPTDGSGAVRAAPSHPSTWHDERRHPRGTSRRCAAPAPAPGHGSSRQRRRRGPRCILVLAVRRRPLPT